MNHNLKYNFLLMLAALIWGSAFVAQSVGMDYLGPFSFNCVRSFMGSLVLLPVIWFMDRQKKETAEHDGQKTEEGTREQNKKVLLSGGLCCGVILTLSTSLQQIGIKYTTAGKAGFITALYILIVPLLGLILGKKVGNKTWLGVALAVAGMYLLCIKEGFSLSRGDALVFIGSVLFTVHILVIDHFSPKADGVELSCIQFLTAGVISSVLAFVFEKPELSALAEGIIPLAYAGILSSGVAYTLQVIGQRDTDPAVASLLLSMESVFSVLAGWMLLGQALSARELMGCALVFGAVILVQLPTGKRRLDKKRA